jgi:hypothetical protein
MSVVGTISDIVKAEWRTLATGQDYALMVPISKFIDEGHGPTHYLCVFHKYGNMSALSRYQEPRRWNCRSTGNVCFAKDKHEHVDPTEEMTDMQSDLHHCLGTNVRQPLALFAVSFKAVTSACSRKPPPNGANESHPLAMRPRRRAADGVRHSKCICPGEQTVRHVT